MTKRTNIIVLGASSLIAPWILKRLTRMNLSGQYYSRKQLCLNKTNNFIWRLLDTSFPTNFKPQPHSIVISLLPLWLLPPLLPQLKNCQQLIAFSTTSIFAKKNSTNPMERKLIKTIRTAENDIIQAYTKQRTPWTILRPTLIYDGQNDHNITAMARFIQKWQILPIAAPAIGLRQPVYADDLAAAAVAAIKNPLSYNNSFNLGGGEILTYQQMANRVFQALGKRSRILPLPPMLIYTICWLIKFVSKEGPNAAMFMRMNKDLIYDFTNAKLALNYKPRPFQPNFSSEVKEIDSLFSIKITSFFR